MACALSWLAFFSRSHHLRQVLSSEDWFMSINSKLTATSVKSIARSAG